MLCRKGKAGACRKEAVRAAKVHVKRDSLSSKSLSQEEEVLSRYEVPCRTLAGRECYQDVPSSHHRRELVTCQVQRHHRATFLEV